MGEASPRRRILVPEVIQTSSMDCGPAALKALLDGCGVPVSYGRLREACQTSVDGTSIDTLEEVARALGLDAVQTLVPIEHVTRPGACTMPCLAVVRLGSGQTHFVVLWARRGPFLEIMDPGSGRQLVRARGLEALLYRHTHAVPEEGWRAWATSPTFVDPLRERLRELGIPRTRAQGLVDAAAEAEGYRSLAALDAAARLLETLVASGALDRGPRVATLLATLHERALAGDEAAIPPAYWSVAAPPDAELHVTGAVLLQVRGRLVAGAREPADATAAPPELSPELAAALHEPAETRPFGLGAMIREGGVTAVVTLAALVATTSGALLLEALLFRGLLEVSQRVAAPEQRLGFVAVLMTFLGALFLVHGATTLLGLSIGRRLEATLRVRYFEKLPRLHDHYFRSRLASDMAERGHMLVLLRRLPELGAALLRTSIDLCLVGAALVWLDPTSVGLVAATVLAGVVPPFLVQPLLAERELRARSHQGALTRYYLDALRGLVPLRAHAAERALQHEHERVLTEWTRASLRLQAAAVSVEGILSLLTTGLMGLLVLHQLRTPRQGSTALLAVFWALQLPALAGQLATLARHYPSVRNTVLRVFELLRVPEAQAMTEAHAIPEARGAEATGRDARGLSFCLERVTLVAGGHTVLRDVELTARAGEHVAIVGPSGSGKSSLLGLVLGLWSPQAGRVLVEGEVLEGDVITRVRQHTAWVDPAVQLWNAPFLANVEYGARGGAHRDLPGILAAAELAGVVERLPEGLQTSVGEGGGRLSGGEGQRLRFARALFRPDVRLVLLDEAFRGLARDQRRTLLTRARELWARATMLVVTHDLEETLSFPRVVVVEGGAIVEDGAPAELLARAGSVYARLLESERHEVARAWGDPDLRRWRLDAGALREGALP